MSNGTSKEKGAYDIMVNMCPARSSQVAMDCWKAGIGAQSSLRYARWFVERGFAESRILAGDNELTYNITGPYITHKEYKEGQNRVYKAAHPAGELGRGF